MRHPNGIIPIIFTYQITTVLFFFAAIYQYRDSRNFTCRVIFQISTCCYGLQAQEQEQEQEGKDKEKHEEEQHLEREEQEQGEREEEPNPYELLAAPIDYK